MVTQPVADEVSTNSVTPLPLPDLGSEFKTSLFLRHPVETLCVSTLQSLYHTFLQCLDIQILTFQSYFEQNEG